MHNRQNFERAKDIVERRRNNARAQSLSRISRLCEQSKEFSEVSAELSSTGPLIFKVACEGGDITPIKLRNIELNGRRRDIMVSLGYPEDYIDVKYTCPKCSDTGYVDIHMCSCLKELLLTENIKSSGMGRLIEEQCFDNFDMAAFSHDEALAKTMRSNIKQAKEYAEGFGGKSRGRNLLLIGKTGSGKTHISTSIAKEVISRGYTVLYDSAQNIISAFESDKFRSGYGREEPQSDKYMECDLLILDDLGTEFVNQFTVSCLYNLINTRNNRGLSTIISTNLSGEELTTKYDDRIYSRIVGGDYTVLYFGGRDYRLNHKR